MDLKIKIYAEMMKKISRGNYRGNFSNAKPIFIISILDYIIFAKENKFLFGDKLLEEIYKTNNIFYPSNYSTQIIKPFFHLSSEPFYDLVWKYGTTPKSKSITPSAKYLRENLEYAKLDDDLWELLQDSENRAYLKQTLVKTYLNETTPS